MKIKYGYFNSKKHADVDLNNQVDIVRSQSSDCMTETPKSKV